MDAQDIKLSEQQASCLTYVQQVFMLEGNLPTIERISQVFMMSKDTVKKWMDSPEFHFLLRQQGIFLNRVTDKALTPHQLAIANALLNVSDRRSKREKCKDAGVSMQQLAAWQKDAAFREYMKKRAEDLFLDSDDAAYLNVLRNVENGDLNAAKLYLEITGKYQPSVRHDVNLESFLANFIEILQARIKDPELLEQIANDLEMLLKGKKVDVTEPQRAIAVQSSEITLEV